MSADGVGLGVSCHDGVDVLSGNNSHNPLDVHVSSSALRLHDLRSVEPAHRDLERHASHSLFQGGLHPRTAVLERRSTTVDSAGGEVQD